MDLEDIPPTITKNMLYAKKGNHKEELQNLLMENYNSIFVEISAFH